MAEDARNERRLVEIAPQFFVADITRAANYYRDVLGFRIERLWGEPPCFCIPYRDGATLMLSQTADLSRIRPNGSDGCSWDAYIWVKDADALYAELAAAGAQIVHLPVYRKEYGNQEFAVRDPDGYIIGFGQNLTG